MKPLQWKLQVRNVKYSIHVCKLLICEHENDVKA